MRLRARRQNFTHAKNEGAFDGANPVQGVRITTNARESAETYAYNLAQICRILEFLPLLPKAVVATAAFAGLRRGELLALEWTDFSGDALHARFGKVLSTSRKHAQARGQFRSFNSWRTGTAGTGSVVASRRICMNWARTKRLSSVSCVTQNLTSRRVASSRRLTRPSWQQ